MAASGVYELKSQRTNEQTCNKHITARDSVLCLLFDKKKRTFIWLVLWDIPIEMLLHFIANQFPILLLLNTSERNFGLHFHCCWFFCVCFSSMWRP